MVRQCARLAEPDERTDEQYNAGSLTVTIYLPYDVAKHWAAQIPNSGADTLVMNYTDYLGQPGTLAVAVTLWMSDNGYVFLTINQGTQLLVASVNPTFWDTYVTTVNARNVTALAVPLLPCANALRYDYPALLPNTQTPTIWVRDGVQLSPSSSSSSH